MKKTAKRRECKMCKSEFDQYKSTQVVCSPRCALGLAREKSAKKKATETRRAWAAFNLKDKGYQTKKAQHSFNAFIRERDRGLPCISCETTSAKWDAGHFKTVGAYPELRYEEDNCFKQCGANCNQRRGGNIHEMRKGMIARIGLERVEWLEGPHEPKHYTLDEIIEIKVTYRAKLKELKSARTA